MWTDLIFDLVYSFTIQHYFFFVWATLISIWHYFFNFEVLFPIQKPLLNVIFIDLQYYIALFLTPKIYNCIHTISLRSSHSFVLFNVGAMPPYIHDLYVIFTFLLSGWKKPTDQFGISLFAIVLTMNYLYSRLL